MMTALRRTLAALAVLAGWNPLLFSSPAAGTTIRWKSGPGSPFGDRLIFEENVGQAPSRFRYLARGPGYRLLLDGQGAVLALADGSGRWTSARLQLLASRPAAAQGLEPLPSRSHYFLGKEPAAASARHFARVRYQEVYPGIDLVFYGRRRSLEFDFLVRPGADPSRIAWRYAGTAQPALDEDGGLIVETPAGKIRQRPPVAYQESGGRRWPVECRYLVEDGGAVRLALGEYRRRLPLVIDPVVTYATYFGDAGADFVTAMTVDSAGYVYLTGYTRSPSLPGLNGYQQFQAGLDDVFVAKLSPDGKSLVFVTYLGGSAWDYGRAIAVDAAGNVYVAGESWSSGYPVTLDSYRPFCCGVFVTKLDPSGAALVYSTFVGSGSAAALAVDAAGQAYVGGWTKAAFPTTAGAFQETPGGMEDGFLARISVDGAALEYATYVGGGGNDRILDIALDPAGSVHAAGFTESADFPVTAKAVQTGPAGLRDAFLLKISGALDTLQYSSYLGGAGLDYAASVEVGNTGRIYVAGATESSDFPTTAGSFQVFPSGSPPWGFVTAVDPAAGSFVYSTYFGQRIENGGIHLAVDGSGAAFLTGTTTAAVFPTTPDAFQSSPIGGRDGFLARIDAAGANLPFSTRYGGSQDDYIYGVELGPPGSVFLAGITRSADLSATSAAQTSLGGGTDTFLVRLDAFPSPECAYQVSPTNASFPAAGGTGAITVTTDPACTWSADTAAAWITITSPAAATGSGTITYAVAANPSASPRSAAIDVTGESVAVTQSGAAVAPPAAPAGPTVGVAGHTYTYAAADSSGTQGYEYRFDWGDGRLTDWGPATATASWPAPGTYPVRVQARQAAAPANVSAWSDPLNVDIVPATPLNDNGKFVEQCYLDILNRGPDAGGYNYFLNLLNDDLLTRGDLVATLLRGKEFNSFGGFLVRLYRVLLQRRPDIGGWLYWYQRLRSGLTPTAATAAVLNGAEFQNRHGDLTDSQFVTLIYQNALGRPPTSDESSYWTTQLSSQATSRATFATNMITPVPTDAATLNGDLVTDLYLTLLRRAPDPQGYNYHYQNLFAYSLAEEATRILNGTEYRSRFSSSTPQ